MKRRKPGGGGEPATGASKYKPTEREQTILREFSERRDAELATQIKVVPNEKGGLTLELIQGYRRRSCPPRGGAGNREHRFY